MVDILGYRFRPTLIFWPQPFYEKAKAYRVINVQLSNTVTWSRGPSGRRLALQTPRLLGEPNGLQSVHFLTANNNKLRN